jgi:hypothetical protein
LRRSNNTAGATVGEKYAGEGGLLNAGSASSALIICNRNESLPHGIIATGAACIASFPLVRLDSNQQLNR